MSSKLLPGLLLLVAVLISACGSGNGEKRDTATSGEITIVADESFKPLMDAQIAAFEGAYRKVKINIDYKPENEALADLAAGKYRLAVVSREMGNAELTLFERDKIVPRQMKLAEDGVAVIINKANPDSSMTIHDLRQIMAGRVGTWADVHAGSSKDSIVVVFDNNGSSNLNFLIQQFRLPNIGHLKAFAAKSNAEVIEYVRTHPDAMGIIGTNWISDSDDPAAQKFISSVTVMSIAEVPNPRELDFYQPYQAYLSMKLYPLRRDVLVISREPYVGLGAGFMSHMGGEKGQRVVLKSGLLPATMPVRIVGLKNTF